MNGKEAWSVIAPILAFHVGQEPNDKNVLTAAYVTAFEALKEYDERRESARKETK
jgi:hypothetical protein